MVVGVDPEIASSALRLWIAAGTAASLVALCAIALVRWRADLANALLYTAFIVIAATLGGAMSWALLGRASATDHDADRRGLEMRADELTAHALAPGSALPCLDALAGEAVEAACEKALFASPATVAAATSYVAARLTLVSDMTRFSKNGGANIDGALVPLRRSLEADRFGFLAHVLAVRDDCTSENCKALEVLKNSSHVRANLSAATFDGYLDRYLTAWTQSPDSAVADAGPPASPGGQPSHKVVNIDFPTAASIPPVSIMNPEPGTKAAPAAANANPPAADGAAASSSRKPRKQAAAPLPPPAVGQIDPVWTPAPAASMPPPATAPAANLASGPTAPVQLAPPASTQ
jgi:hypothetical protein